MSKTLSTAQELLRYSWSKDLSEGDICNDLKLLEIGLSECLGELYNSMLTALVDNSDAAQYKKTDNTGALIEYSIGDKVFNAECIYESIVNTNSSVLSDKSAWKHPDKFSGNCADKFQELWECYMCPWFSMELVAQRALLGNNKSTSFGLVNATDPNGTFAQVSYKGQQWTADNYKLQASKLYKAMHNYLLKNRDVCFSGYAGYDECDNCTLKPVRQTRRVWSRRGGL